MWRGMGLPDAGRVNQTKERPEMTTTINPRLVLVTALAGASCLAAAIAPTANALTVQRDGSGRVVATAAPGERNHLGVQESSTDPNGMIVVYDAGAGTLNAGAACTPYPDYPYIECDMNPAVGVLVGLGDGDDDAAVSGWDLPAGLPITINGGAGKDVLQTSIYDGDAGVLTGGPGDDTLTGGPGPARPPTLSTVAPAPTPSTTTGPTRGTTPRSIRSSSPLPAAPMTAGRARATTFAASSTSWPTTPGASSAQRPPTTSSWCRSSWRSPSRAAAATTA